MKSRWPVKKLSEVAEIQMGQSPKGTSYNVSGEGVPLINGPVEFGKTPFSRTKKTKFTTEPTKLCKEGDLILCVRGSTTGRMNIAGYDSCIGRGVAAIRSKEYQDWINFFIHANRENIYKLGSGSTFPNVSGVILSKIEIPIPPIAEQKRIVAIMDEAFEGIDSAIANTEKNLANARQLFHSLLKSAIFSKKEGWQSTTIGKQVKLQRGFDITKKQQNPGQVPVVSSGGVKSFHDAAMVKAPGVVIGRKGTLGNVFYLEQDFWPHDTTLWIKEFNENYPRFVYHFFRSLDVSHLDTGTANPALNRNKIHPIKVDWPPVAQQLFIAEKLDVQFEQTQRLEAIYQQKLAALNELKQSILQKAFSGELTTEVGDAAVEVAKEVVAA